MWVSFHAYIHDYHLLDQYLSKEFNQFLDEHKKMYDEYFFIRYWLGGPHVRLRVKTNKMFNQADFFNFFQESVTRFLAKSKIQLVDPATFYSKEMLEGEGIKEVFWKRNGDVEIDQYQPELSRYGGIGNIEIAERMFRISSDLARHVNSKPFHTRLYIAVDLYYFSFLQLSIDICFVSQQYSEMWSTYNSSISDNSSIRKIVEQRGNYIDNHKESLLKAYSQYLKNLSNCPKSTIFSQIHMTNNRMGVNPEFEYWITKYLGMTERNLADET
ncbi:hypothetical protein HCI99_13140 [Listeria booriae]|uniref:Thiopeptide-type bacteriocin biosynthesis domain-containing protein n=1 Tax=Listeria booriae TaxID=1552123 RepID=A0A7X0XF10_9LIST|nr:lantibiotic dehydratase C-terminal domain-containing protein [Listeria booriae]MBC1492763.1 hypothetical protein [Listeria booriae]